MIGDEITSSKIVFVCSDMGEPHLKFIREKCSELSTFSTVSISSRNEQRLGRSPCWRIATDGERRPEIATE
jgi:hypothetical protein